MGFSALSSKQWSNNSTIIPFLLVELFLLANQVKARPLFPLIIPAGIQYF